MTNKKLIWSRLKNFKCPDCNGQLIGYEDTKMYECGKCKFKISDNALADMIKKLSNTKKDYSYKEENQELLNNL